jgi:hypothetical protein
VEAVRWPDGGDAGVLDARTATGGYPAVLIAARP